MEERKKKKKKKKEENEDDKTRFSPLSGSSLLAIRSSMLCCCRVGATLESRSNSLLPRTIHQQAKYQCLNANTCIVAAILFS